MPKHLKHDLTSEVDMYWIYSWPFELFWSKPYTLDSQQISIYCWIKVWQYSETCILRPHRCTQVWSLSQTDLYETYTCIYNWEKIPGKGGIQRLISGLSVRDKHDKCALYTCYNHIGDMSEEIIMSSTWETAKLVFR